MAQRRALKEKTDSWSRKILVGEGRLLEKVTGLERNHSTGEEGRLLDDEEGNPVCKVDPHVLNLLLKWLDSHLILVMFKCGR